MLQLRSADPKNRLEAVGRLQLVRSADELEGTLSALIGALQDEDHDVRIQALYALGGIVDSWGIGSRHSPLFERAILPAFVQALNDPHWDVRRSSALGLSRFGPKARVAVPALARAARDIDPSVRFFAMDALGKIGPDSAPAIPSLVEALDDEPLNDYPYRGWIPTPHKIALTFVSIGPAAIPVLTKALEHENPDVRDAARLALERISVETAPSGP